MPLVKSRRALLDEIDEEYARLKALIEMVPKGLWESSRVNSSGWSLKDVLAHIADWAERCDAWCTSGDTIDTVAPPAPGFTWRETRALNHAVYLKRRRHRLARVHRDLEAGHAALRRHVTAMSERDLLAVGRFAWCGNAWNVATYIRANTASHYRWGCKHLRAALRAHAVPGPALQALRTGHPPRGSTADRARIREVR